MDPLSVTASVIAIGQAVAAIAVGVRVLKSLSNTPTEFSALLNDLGMLQAVLELTKASLETLQTSTSRPPTRSLTALQTLHEALRRATTELDELAKRLLAQSKGLDKKGRHRIPRIKWLREKDNIAKLHELVQRLYLELSTCFAAVSASQGTQQTVLVSDVKSIIEASNTCLVDILHNLERAQFPSVDLNHILSHACEVLTRNEQSLQDIGPQLGHIMQQSGESVELLQRHATVLGDIRASLSLITRDLEPIKTAFNAQMAFLGNRGSSAKNTIRSAGRDTDLSLTTRTSIRGARFPLCKCSCHRVAWARSLPWLHPAFGTLSLKYSALHGRCEPCNTSLCHSASDTFFNVQYHFPPWLAARAVLASLSWRTLTGLGASLWIRVPRIVYKMGIAYILESDDIESLERRLSNLQILPTDIEGFYGRTLLTFALDSSMWSCIPSLLRFGADPRMPDLSGRSAADWAREYLHTTHEFDVGVRQILQQLAESDGDEPRSASIIHDAILGNSKIPLEECILAQPCHINTLDDLGNTPLHWAVMMGDLEAVHTLANLGADVNHPTRHNGETPLHLACHWGAEEIAMELIARGASIHLQDFTGRTPLHVCYNHLNLTKLLLSLGADPNAQIKFQWTPLYCLLGDDYMLHQQRTREIVKAYAEAGANLDAAYQGLTPLHIAAQENVSLVPLFLELGAKANVATDDEETLLHLLATMPTGFKQIGDIPPYLLRGLNPDLLDSRGLTPFDRLECRVTEERNFAGRDSLILGDVVLFVELILELRELNWEAGLFLECKEEFEADGSHNRMRRWVRKQRKLFDRDEDARTLVCGSLQPYWAEDTESTSTDLEEEWETEDDEFPSMFDSADDSDEDDENDNDQDGGRMSEEAEDEEFFDAIQG